MKPLVALVLLLFTVNAWAAKNLQDKLELQSRVLTEKRTVTVYLPEGYYDEPDKTYPAIYVLDGDGNGASVASLNQRMVLSNGALQQIVIAIHSIDRLHDYAPTVNRDPRGPVGVGGGADNFINFVSSELMPLIEENYRVSDFRTLAGHSVAGLLVIHSFHAYPELFQAHLAFSPAVWWGARETSGAAQDFVTSGNVPKSYLYLNIGSESGDLRVVYDQFANAVQRNRPLDLALTVDVFPHAEHGLTFPAGLYNALHGLYKFQQRLKTKPQELR